jgi:hypothetical protein
MAKQRPFTSQQERLDRLIKNLQDEVAALKGMIDTERSIVAAQYVKVQGASSSQIIKISEGGGLILGDTKGDRLRLRPAGVILPDTNAPAVMKVSGTDRLMLTLDFDQTTSESAYWGFVLGDKAAEAVRYHLCWSAAGGSVGDNVKWDIKATGVANDEVFTTGGSSDSVSVTDALIATGDLHVATVNAGAVTPFDANHHVFIEFSRDTGVADNLAADAQFLGGLIEFRQET